jgi:hypothetical protein
MAPRATQAKRPAFTKKGQPPSEAEFSARLPAAVGKRFEALRAFLKKQKGVTEELYFYGPKTGWAFRYLRGSGQSLCSIALPGAELVGIIALDAAAQAAVDWEALSPVTRHARKVAHGTPSLLWMDVPLAATGAADFKALLKAKLRSPAAA